MTRKMLLAPLHPQWVWLVMAKDFYLNDRALAGYLEKDWYDHIVKSDPRKPSFEFASFAPSELYSDYHERLVDFLLVAAGKVEFKPRQTLGSGRVFRTNILRGLQQDKIDSVGNLDRAIGEFISAFGKIFAGEDVARVSVLKGNMGFEEVQLNTVPIKAACSGVQISPINKSFQEVDPDLGKFDLVICSNVIDQCTDHMKLVEFLKRSTARSGSCWSVALINGMTSTSAMPATRLKILTSSLIPDGLFSGKPICRFGFGFLNVIGSRFCPMWWLIG